MMTTEAIPAWNEQGVLPPTGSDPTHIDGISPHIVDLPVLVDRFVISRERRKILAGLLAFRAELHKAGIVAGFQWLDGSFMENIEQLEERPPHDMDVVNFIRLPEKMTQESLGKSHPQLFDNARLKRDFLVDTYFVESGQPLCAQLARRIAYWHGLWSHRRDGLWKGYVQIDLDPAQDGEAHVVLNSVSGGLS